MWRLSVNFAIKLNESIMKRIIYFCVFALFLGLMQSCVQNGGAGSGDAASPENQETKLIPLEKFVFDFIHSHPDLDNNDITREKASQEFKNLFVTSVNEMSLLKDVPVKFYAVNKLMNGEYMAQFRAWAKPYLYSYADSIDDVCFDAVAKLSEDKIIPLKEGEFYYLKANFISEVPSPESFVALFGRETDFTTFKWGARKSSYGKKWDVHLGMMYLDIDSVVKYEKK